MGIEKTFFLKPKKHGNNFLSPSGPSISQII